jgi:Ca2+-binding EF-hand superfamily protein
MVAGLLNMAHEMTMCYIAGGVMMGIGVIAVITGSRANKNLATLRKSLSDDEFLWLEFLKHDKDRDGYLNPSEFAQFIWDLGLEFDDLYTLKAFTTIDTDHDQKIAYREFVRWWSQVRLNHIS